MTPADFRTIRERFALTQAQAASRVGVDRNTWNRWEMGALKPHPLRIPFLLALLDEAQQRS